MFIIPCKYTDVSPIFECVNSIIRFHPNEKILIVDSYSDDDSYLINFNQYENVIVSKFKNKHYEFGALYYAYEEFPNEKYYALIHDSIILKRDWSEFINNDITYSLLYFEEFGPFQTPEYNYVKEVIDITEYYPHNNIGHFGVFGSMAVYKRDAVEKFSKKGLFKSLLPNNKFESQMAERISYICLKQDGYNIIENSIEGDYINKLIYVNGDQLTYFRKIFLGRQ
jgi:hypothetical protein